jgi:hypothetical protein
MKPLGELVLIGGAVLRLIGSPLYFALGIAAAAAHHLRRGIWPAEAHGELSGRQAVKQIHCHWLDEWRRVVADVDAGGDLNDSSRAWAPRTATKSPFPRTNTEITSSLAP